MSADAKLRKKCWQQCYDDVLNEICLKPERLTKNLTPVPRTISARSHDLAEIRNREKLPITNIILPWSVHNATKVSFDTEIAKVIKENPRDNPPVPERVTKADTPEKRKEATLLALEKLGGFSIEMWTDGTVSTDQIGFGAGIIYDSRVNSPLKGKASGPSGFLSSSYKSELVALRCTLEKLIQLRMNESMLDDITLLICTDSQSSVSSLSNGPLRQDTSISIDIWKSLLYLLDHMKVSRIHVQWVAAHCGVDRNEEVDKYAETEFTRIGTVNQHTEPISLNQIKATVKNKLKHRYLNNLKTSRHRYEICGNNFSDLKSSSNLSRSDETRLAQLRTGECHRMGKFRERINLNKFCRWCDTNGTVLETVNHVYNDCWKLTRLKDSLNIKNGAKILSTDPPTGLKFFERACALINA